MTVKRTERKGRRDDHRQASGEAILNLEPVATPATPEELRREIDEAHDRFD
jgi:hypothetical protein